MMSRQHLLHHNQLKLEDIKVNICTFEKKVKTSVADPFHFDLASDPRIRFVEKRIRIRLKIEKIPTFLSLFFLLISQKY